MVSLGDEEAEALRQRLRDDPAARSAEETIAVSQNATTSVTLTPPEKAAVLEVLTAWLAEPEAGTGSGPAELRDALAAELEHEI
jgi:hypothetical protein